MKFLFSLLALAFSLSAFSYNITLTSTFVGKRYNPGEGEWYDHYVERYRVTCKDVKIWREYTTRAEAEANASAYCKENGTSFVSPSTGVKPITTTRPSLGETSLINQATVTPQGGFAPATNSTFGSSSY